MLKLKLTEPLCVSGVEGSHLTIHFSSSLDIMQAARSVYGNKNKVGSVYIYRSVFISANRRKTFCNEERFPTQMTVSYWTSSGRSFPGSGSCVLFGF